MREIGKSGNQWYNEMNVTVAKIIVLFDKKEVARKEAITLPSKDYMTRYMTRYNKRIRK